jgi:hypothetical protein
MVAGQTRTNLMSGVLWNEHEPSSEIEMDPNHQPGSPEPPSIFIAHIIFCLGSGTDNLPHPLLLEELEIQDLSLDSNLLRALRTFLRLQIGPVPIEKGTEDTRGCQLTIRRCILEAKQLIPPRSFTIRNDITFTFTELEEFAAVLERHGFFTDTDVKDTADETVSPIYMD